ncbi:acetate kinase [Pectobacterium aroidearum]|jgi:acetate kinase|uniref:Acetate kinase n=2 Tax=Pectobacterium TaxID=122277 RepID=ACKA_PECCP|nr:MULTISPECIES: acetate kinase [Pectobacterium]C6DA54.1 RecName: Full=Acetate kinase; AltName: Full=Acetokinase [Pectobacterium carotovorum subsp. carotovorum PC1]ACT13810.1 acetate kinase [Pectobacterium carotovorum subsp. carotovorum PC1]MBA0204266.1 acetate kinase [Pectobacterium aroidearum]MBA5199010.1 acetate kinase [Pectobacterium aroidearum]MBA5204444.1 acetate kinase [Pectobacterium aroidearum]MBA5226511.1 acetate kinase [Pectobacterium aroidearum]
MSSKLVLVLNCGSSSLKFAIIDAINGEEYLSGLAECFNLPEARIKWKMDGGKHDAELGAGAAHSEALNFIVNTILSQKPELSAQLVAIGHRIVHGGEKFTQSAIITDDVLQGIKDSVPFAPLHNPAHLIGIEEALKSFPHLADKNVAVFDTAFHQTMPEESYLYALPYKLYKENHIRRYGFHGTSHYFVSREAAKVLNKPVEELNVITCHLGNGGSVTAIRNGECVDTSMGLTPLEGLVMGTRCGDIDPAVIFHLHDALGMDVASINKLLTKESGLQGLTEVTSDCRYVEDNYETKADAKRAMDVYCHRLAKYIGSYSALMEGRLDAVIFTGGIGENAAMVRELSLKKLGLLGFDVDHERNLAARFGKGGNIAKDGTRPALVIPTNEELVIAEDAYRLTA